MAVIGARPATIPWFGGRRIRPRIRTRPGPARRARRFTAGHRLARKIDVRPLLMAIIVAAGLGLFYLSQSAHVAATGYKIDLLESQLAQSHAEQQQLIWAIGEARSPAEVTHRAKTELKLVLLEDGAVNFAPSANRPAD
jgi:hypothetical protein